MWNEYLLTKRSIDLGKATGATFFHHREMMMPSFPSLLLLLSNFLIIVLWRLQKDDDEGNVLKCEGVIRQTSTTDSCQESHRSRKKEWEKMRNFEKFFPLLFLCPFLTRRDGIGAKRYLNKDFFFHLRLFFSVQ
jgi:hypothetical protein